MRSNQFVLGKIAITPVILTILTVLGGCDSEPAQITETKPRPAKLHTVVAADARRELSFPAVVQAAQSSQLTFSTAGKIQVLNVLEGQRINKGDVIATLDSENAENTLVQAQAEYENARTEYARAKKLSTQGAISKSELDGRRTKRDVTEATLKESQKALDDTVMVAPFAGMVSQVSAKQFQNVQPNEAVVFVQSEEVEALIHVPGSLIAVQSQIEPIETLVTLDRFPELEIDANFREMAGAADPDTQTYAVTMSFEPPEAITVLPGMTATVQGKFLFHDPNKGEVEGVSVPLTAVLAEGDTQHVWRVNPDTLTISKQPIVIKSPVDAELVVVDGLAVGDTIISAGVSFFHDGMIVSEWQTR